MSWCAEFQYGMTHSAAARQFNPLLSTTLRGGGRPRWSGRKAEGQTVVMHGGVCRPRCMCFCLPPPAAAAEQITDARNLYLAAEGVIREGDLAARELTKAELAIRDSAEQVRKKDSLLRSSWQVGLRLIAVRPCSVPPPSLAPPCLPPPSPLL